MNLGKRLTVTTRAAWRAWLARNHAKAKEIWLVYFYKASGSKRIPYNDAVEEALCFGWIDSTVKKLDEHRFCQRFSPRRPKSNLSELNTERIRMMIKAKRMTPAGLRAVAHAFDHEERPLTIATDIRKALKEAKAWENFQKFPESYKRIRVAFIEGGRSRPEVFAARLRHFVKMTAQNKRYGMLRD